MWRRSKTKFITVVDHLANFSGTDCRQYLQCQAVLLRTGTMKSAKPENITVNKKKSVPRIEAGQYKHIRKARCYNPWTTGAGEVLRRRKLHSGCLTTPHPTFQFLHTEEKQTTQG